MSYVYGVVMPHFFYQIFVALLPIFLFYILAIDNNVFFAIESELKSYWYARNGEKVDLSVKPHFGSHIS